MGKIYQVVVNGIKESKQVIDLCNTDEEMQSMTVLQLKERIMQKLPHHIELDRLRLIFTDKMLDGDFTLLSMYGIQHMSEIQLVLRMDGGQYACQGPQPQGRH